MRPRQWKQYLNEEIADGFILEAQLVALTFAVGINDAVTFTDFHTFVSNQTGSTVFLAVGALEVTKDVINLNHVGLSLGGFLSGCLIAGRLANHFGRRRRAWLLTTNLIQTLMMYIAAALRKWYVGDDKNPKAFAVIFFLAFGAGMQISMARAINIAELPTGMITTGYTDFFNDPDILGLHNRKRNRRFGSVSSLLVGAFVGATALKYEGPALSILLAAITKSLVTLSFLLNKASAKSTPQASSENSTTKQGV